MNKLLIIIPCFNEERSIAPLLQEIKELGTEWDTLVVDDGSTDQTSMIAQALSKTVRLATNSGIGCTVQTGIKFAQINNYDFAVQLDGDGQHPPKEIFKLLEEYQKTKANLIIGSRFLENDGFQSTASRRIGISILRTIISSLIKKQITDPTSGYRLLDKKALEFFSKDYPLDYPEPISIITGFESGLTTSETPVCMRERVHGASSIIGLKSILYMFRVTCYIFLARLRRFV